MMMMMMVIDGDPILSDPLLVTRDRTAEARVVERCGNSLHLKVISF
jgi:hypothetical protein